MAYVLLGQVGEGGRAVNTIWEIETQRAWQLLLSHLSVERQLRETIANLPVNGHGVWGVVGELGSIHGTQRWEHEDSS